MCEMQGADLPVEMTILRSLQRSWRDRRIEAFAGDTDLDEVKRVPSRSKATKRYFIEGEKQKKLEGMF